MSEADRPINPSPSASSDATPLVPEPIGSSPPDLGDDEGWETVNLPNTISIDALEQQSDNHPETALALPLAGLTAPGGLATTTPEAWKSDNLLDRIATLEIAIQEYRDRQGQDQARFDAQRQLLAQRTIELKAANEQIEVQNRHIEALEAQTAQQQTTIDNLTAQVESLSQQLAQIERECALTQQRYMQESQLRQKAEINTQELRSRLHRQQHHTLQFKAALEKCLEPPLNPDTTPTNSTASPTQVNTNIFPKASPIQPWSAPVAEMGRLLGLLDQGTGGDQETSKPGNGEQGTGKRQGRGAGDPTAAPGGTQRLRQEGPNGKLRRDPTAAPGGSNQETGFLTRTSDSKPEPPFQKPGFWVPPAPLPPSPPASSPSPRPPVSPSPLVYPKDANVKKRRSLAAVQLPNFAT